ncbi:MAG: winged helix-turn-helix domain-containing protein [Nitrososphaerales archaeon]
MKYRSSTEIIDSMLRSIGSGSTKTQIMYRSYLSFSQLKEYLKLLEERRLIAVDSAAKLYTLTEKGLQFMNAYDRIQELVPNAEERERSIQKSVAQAPEVFNY